MTAVQIADQLLIEHIANTIRDRIIEDLTHAYGWPARFGVDLDPMLIVHERADVIERLIATTSQVTR